MNIPGRLKLLRQRLVNLYYRVLNGLRFFPFTLLIWAFNVAFRALQLRLGGRLVRVGEVAGEAGSLPRSVILWLGCPRAGRPSSQYDLCLRLPRESGNASLHDAVSVLLAFPGFRSVNLYWDSSCLSDDLPLLQAKRDRDNPVFSALPYQDLDSPGIRQFETFLLAEHERIALPVAAARDAQTFLKRVAGKAHAIFLNIPAELRALADALRQAYPDARFFDLSPAPPPLDSRGGIQSCFDYGLTLHERMALVQAADAYVGEFDELGCAALMSGRPAILLGGATRAKSRPIGRGDTALWFPGPIDTDEWKIAALPFLSRHLTEGET